MARENKRNEKPISLKPLRVPDALRKALSTPPPHDERPAGKKRKPAK